MKRENYFLLFIIGILLLLLFGGAWWYNQKLNDLEQRQQTIAYQAEGQYQRNFGELSDSIQAMNGQLAQLLVTTSQEQLLLGLSSLWREVYSAINYLGGLPVAMHELESTDLLLNDVAEYSYYLLRKNVLQQKPLSQQDWNQLEEFYRRSRVVQTELDELGSQILSQNLQLTALSLEDEENVVNTTFRSIESQVHAFPELKFEEGVRKIEPEPRVITGEQITQIEAVAAADTFLDTLQIAHNQGQVEFSSQNAKIPIYGVRYQNESEDTVLYVEVSQKGGQVLQFYQTRDIGAAQYNTQEATEQALSFLQELDFTDMACVDNITDDRVADLTFVPKMNGIYIYSDMVKIQIALDDNSILNYDQTSYATRHYQRQLPAPTVSKEQIFMNMNPNFQVEDIQLALITDEYSINEILTYEVRGTVVEEAFSVFVDAQSGQEIRIVRR